LILNFFLTINYKMLSKGILARIWTPNKETFNYEESNFNHSDELIIYGIYQDNRTLKIFNNHTQQFGKIDIKYIWNPTKLMKKKRQDTTDYLSNYYSRDEIVKFCKKNCTCI